MKRNNFQFSILNCQLIILLLFTAGCNNMHNANENEEDSTDIMMTAPAFTSYLDSLEWIFNNPDLPMKMRLSACDILTFNLASVDVNKAQSYALKGLDMAEKIKNDSLIGCFNRNLGMAYEIKEIRDTATIYFQKTLDYALENKNDYLESFVYLAFGLMYSNMSRYEMSADYYEKALRICEKKGYEGRYSAIIFNIAITYLKMSNYERAEHYFLKAKEFSRKNSYLEMLAHTYLNMGIMYYEQNKLEEAREVSDESLKIFQSISNTSGEALALMNRSRLSASEKKYDRAMEAAHKSLVLAEKSGYVYVIKNALFELSQLYFDVGNYKLSEEYAHRGMALLDSTEITEIWILYKKLIPIYIKQGKKEDAIHTFAKFDSISTVVNSAQVQSTYNELEVRYETEKKELEIERQQHIISRQNLQHILLFGGIVLCVIILALLWYMLRMRNRRNLALSERNDVLAEMNATKDKFFSIISHDLRNPAVAQRDALQLLVQNCRQWDVDRLKTYCRDLLKSAESQVELLCNLLSWAQIQTERITYTPETFILSDLLSDLTLIRKMADNKGVIFNTQIPDYTLATGDSNMLAIVIRNLLTNAIKFTPAGGQVTLDISPRYCRDEERPVSTGGYVISVSDTGIGMTEEQISNLFRIDYAHSRKGTVGEQGSGLGLIVCKELLEKHGSELHADSEEGKGSRFWFEI